MNKLLNEAKELGVFFETNQYGYMQFTYRAILIACMIKEGGKWKAWNKLTGKTFEGSKVKSFNFCLDAINDF